MGRSNAKILIGMLLISLIIVIVIFWMNPAGAETTIEINENLIQDEIGKVIKVEIHDGISSADSLR